MNKENKKMDPIEDIKVKNEMTVSELIEKVDNAGGFSAKKVAEAVEIFKEMKDEEVTTFLSFPAAIISTGTRGVIKELVKRNLVDVVVTTCGTLDHDLARIWKDYYHGSFTQDDAQLHHKGINRIGSVLAPQRELWAHSGRETATHAGRNLRRKKETLHQRAGVGDRQETGVRRE